MQGVRAAPVRVHRSGKKRPHRTQPGWHVLAGGLAVAASTLTAEPAQAQVLFGALEEVNTLAVCSGNAGNCGTEQQCLARVCAASWPFVAYIAWKPNTTIAICITAER